MASLIVRKLDASVVTLDDMGFSITGPIGTEYDLLAEQANDVSASADLISAIGTTLEVLHPIDGTTALSTANGILAIENHNLTHYGISGGRFGSIDNPGTTLADNFIPQYDLTSDSFIEVDPATIVTGNAEAIEDIVGALVIDGTDTTAAYNDVAGTLQINVDDVFLRNTGDVLDSGTLTVATGATIDVATGGSLTIQDAPTGATDAANKAYVDSIAAGLDTKESVRAGTTADLAGFTIVICQNNTIKCCCTCYTSC